MKSKLKKIAFVLACAFLRRCIQARQELLWIYQEVNQARLLENFNFATGEI